MRKVHFGSRRPIDSLSAFCVSTKASADSDVPGKPPCLPEASTGKTHQCLAGLEENTLKKQVQVKMRIPSIKTHIVHAILI